MSTYNPWGAIPPAPPGTQPTYAHMAAQPAYTPVQVRQSFYPPPQQPYVNLQPPYTQTPPYGQTPPYAQPPPYTQPPPIVVHAQPPQLPQPEQKKKKVDFPEAVKRYVGRSFDPENEFHDVTSAEMQARLKQEISAATQNDAILSIDWDNHPLPQVLIRNERAASRGATGTWVGGRYIPNPSSVNKRKSPEEQGNGHIEVSVPWRNANQPGANGFEQRVTYVSTETVPTTRRLPDSLPTKASKKQHALEKRQKRFDGGYKSTYQRTPTPDPDAGPVIGRSQSLEKKYFRLTSAPNPDHVRPESILRQTLTFLLKKWKKERNYSYICDQFKSLRQDLTVQHITNSFTVEVYEVHARIALEKGDLGEYNQCQTQLRALYTKVLGGHPVEFKAYRILYFIHTCNRTALNDVLAELTTAEKEEKAIKHALNVRSALALGNYHKFFRLYLDAPNMGSYIMDMFAARERLVALSNICKAYKPGVNLRFVTEELGFESDRHAAEFICDYEGGKELLEERDDGTVFFLSGKAGQLFESAKSSAFAKIDIKGQI